MNPYLPGDYFSAASELKTGEAVLDQPLDTQYQFLLLAILFANEWAGDREREREMKGSSQGSLWFTDCSSQGRTGQWNFRVLVLVFVLKLIHLPPDLV